MKHNHIFAAAIATALMMTAAVSSATAAGADHSAYGFQIGKGGRTTQAAPYAGMNYEGGEQGDTSSYGYRIGKVGRTEDGRAYVGMDYAGGEQGDISAYSFQAGRAGKPWNSAK